jgi:hypothetical protein
MTKTIARAAAIVLALSIFQILTPARQETSSSNSVAVREFASPAGPSSLAPNLIADSRGRVFLSWVEKRGDKGHALRFSVLEKERWSEALTISEGENWFVNWADFPSMVALEDGTLAAHWLVKSGPGTYAYDVKVALSRDGGKTWSKPMTLHRDQTETEHGFVSMVPGAGNQVGAVWLDGRNFKSAGGHSHGPSPNEMTLRYTTVDASGKLSEEILLDGRVCECCQTGAAMTAEGAVVVYRDRSSNEVRDISVVRNVKGRWTKPRSLHEDGWRIEGCPVNGPAIDGDGRRVAVAWFTAVGDRPRANVAFSTDAGATFGGALQFDDGAPLGRVDVELLTDGAALVVWLERGAKGGIIKARRVASAGARAQSFVVADTSAARSSGFPRIARAGDDVIFAWTDASTPSRVRVARAAISKM